jgi:hypothetical protein
MQYAVVGDGGGSWKSFDPTDGVEVSSLGSSSDGVGGVVVEGVSPIVSGVLGFGTGGVDSLMEISSAAPSSSTWKLNHPKAISKPLVLAEADPVKLEMGSTVVVTRGSMANTGVDLMMVGDVASMSVDTVVSMMVGDVVSMSMVDDVMSMSMAVGDAESMSVVGDEPSILVDASSLVIVGEGASESVDPDPVVPMVGAH